MFSAEELEDLTRALQVSENDAENHSQRFSVAFILLSVHVDALTLQAALLMGNEEQYDTSSFAPAVQKIIKGVAWLNTFDNFYRAIEKPSHAELLRRMFLAEVGDVRAVVVKLAYLLHHLQILVKNPEDLTGVKIARETLDIFAPLVNRLGIGELKWQLEDLSFRFLEPQEYKKLSRELDESRTERDEMVMTLLEKIQEKLSQNSITAEVYGRPKHLYSIWKKMQEKHIPLENIYDLLAVRIIVENINECYAVLGLVHSIWQHIPEEFCDYIANPKKNGYQSIHTVVAGENGKPVEIQIRTQEMHAVAECGIAAHWRYKEGVHYDETLEKSIESLRKFLDQREGGERQAPLEVFADQIFVFTPKGQVVRLKKGATPLDFAYTIHTELGHRCRGAKVNGRIVPLHYALQSKETVEVLTQKNGHPMMGWLDAGSSISPHTKRKIRQWFTKNDPEKSVFSEKQTPKKESVKAMPHKELPRIPENTSALPKVSIHGNTDLMTHFAQCCHPTAPMPIVGYVTIGYGISVHARECINIANLPSDKKGRCIAVEWGE